MIPKYRKRPDRDSAFVEIDKKRYPLPGKYGSPESREAYAGVIRDMARQPEITIVGNARISDLLTAYLDHAEIYYSRKEYLAIRSVAQVVLDTAIDKRVGAVGEMSVDRMSAMNLEIVRNTMVEKGWSRPHINHQVNRLRRVFKWGVLRELVHGSVVQSMLALPALQEGRTLAPEPPPVMPADWGYVQRALLFASPTLSAMGHLQYLTGMRSQNLCAMRAKDIDQRGPVWLYVPEKHKMKWRKHHLNIYLGPRCREIILPFMDRAEDAFFFSPQESEIWRLSNPRTNSPRKRKTKLYPGDAARYARYVAARKAVRPYPKSVLRLNTYYTTDTYRQSVNYCIKRANAACERLGLTDTIPHWFPHQLRHTRATEIRRSESKYGLEGAQVFLGHAHADVTQIYAERDMDLARRIALEMG